jgi:hypothetical protein
VLVDTLGNDLVELHRRALADDKHDDRVAPAWGDAEADNVRLVCRDVLPRDKFKLRVDLDHRFSRVDPERTALTRRLRDCSRMSPEPRQ